MKFNFVKQFNKILKMKTIVKTVKTIKC